MGDNILQLQFMEGVNLLDDPKRLRKGEVPYAKNLYPVIPGVLSTRRACGYAQEFLGHNGAGARAVCTAFTMHPDPAVASWVFATYDPHDDVHRICIKDALSGSPIEGAYANSIPGRPFFLTYGKKLYVFGQPVMSGSSAGYVIEKGAAPQYSAQLVPFSFNGSENSFQPRGACVLRNRIVYWGLGPGYENHIVWSDPYDPATIGDNVRAINGRSAQIGAIDGDRIVACVEITQSAVGSPTASALLVLKERSAYIITGEPDETATVSADPLGSLEVSHISYECGCSSFDTLKRTPYGLIWAGPDDVWSFATGQLPIRIGTKIRPALRDCPPSQRWQWFAAYHDGAYRLAVHGNANNVYAGSTAVSVLRMTEQWWIDLRNGLPQSHVDAQWWGPQIYFPRSVADNVGIVAWRDVATPLAPADIYGFAMMGVASVNGEDKLVAIEGVNDVLGSGSGDTYWGVIDLNSSSLYDGGVYVNFSAGTLAEMPETVGSDYTGTQIPFELRTPELYFDDPMLNKLYRGSEVRLAMVGFDAANLNLYAPATTSTLTLEILSEGGTADASQNVTVTQSGFVLGTGALPGMLVDKFQAVLLPYSATRLIARYMQLKLSSVARARWAFADILVRARTIPRRIS